MATHFSILVWRIPWTEKPGYGAEDLRGMPLRTRKREPLEEAQANHPWTPRVPLDSLTEPQRGGQEVRTSRKIRSC